MKFRVTVTEKLSTSVVVDAEDDFEAEQMVLDKYKNGEITICSEDYVETEFESHPLDSKLKPFDVTFARTGCAVVYAEDEADAISKADELAEDEISWTDGFNATDAQEC